MTRRGVVAFVWRRSDFRESSRIVTLLSRDHGRLRALAKGAHRPDSPLLGRLDHLNLVSATLAGRGELKLLSRCTLLEERRELRAPRRFLAASWLVELVDSGLTDGRPEPELFDLVQGGVHLIERCPEGALGTIVLGIELRFLAALGVLPPLDSCAQCAAAPVSVANDYRSLLCADHREGAGTRPGAATLAWLARLAAAPGRSWPAFTPCPDFRIAERVVGGFVTAALEHRPKLRRHALDSR